MRDDRSTKKVKDRGIEKNGKQKEEKEEKEEVYEWGTWLFLQAKNSIKI